MLLTSSPPQPGSPCVCGVIVSPQQPYLRVGMPPASERHLGRLVCKMGQVPVNTRSWRGVFGSHRVAAGDLLVPNPCADGTASPLPFYATSDAVIGQVVRVLPRSASKSKEASLHRRRPRQNTAASTTAAAATQQTPAAPAPPAAADATTSDSDTDTDTVIAHITVPPAVVGMRLHQVVGKLRCLSPRRRHSLSAFSQHHLPLLLLLGAVAAVLLSTARVVVTLSSPAVTPPQHAPVSSRDAPAAVTGAAVPMVIHSNASSNSTATWGSGNSSSLLASTAHRPRLRVIEGRVNATLVAANSTVATNSTVVAASMTSAPVVNVTRSDGAAAVALGTLASSPLPQQTIARSSSAASVVHVSSGGARVVTATTSHDRP
jgi:hypothetical protein